MRDYKLIPTELREPPLWVWYYEAKDPRPGKKPRKHPILAYATPENRKANLKPLDHVLASAAGRKDFAGVQRFVEKSEGLTYIDLDHARDPGTGALLPWALKIIEDFDTYTENSASGTGFHLVCRATLATDYHVDGDNVEIYSGNQTKLLAITGDIYQSRATIQTRQEQAERLLGEHRPTPQNGKSSESGKPGLPIIEESDVDTAEEPLPEFPRLVGPLHDIASAITHDLAYEHKALALLTYVGAALSGRVMLAGEKWLQPRLYGCTVGPAGFGKTAVDKEVQAALDGLFNLDVIDSVESGQALVETLSRKPRLVLAPDELADLFIKGKQTRQSNSTLLSELLKLYEKNKTSRRVITRRKRKSEDDPTIDETVVLNAHLAVFGGATTQNFESIWQATGGGRTGLQSRFCLSYSDQTIPRLRTATDERALREAVDSLKRAFDRYLTDDEPSMTYFHLSQDAQFAITNWRPFEEELFTRHPRIIDMAKRYALIIAATNGGTNAIDESTMLQGLDFSDYQIAVKDRLMPSDADSNIVAFENRILKFYRGKDKPVSKEVCMSKIRPEDSPGGFTAFNAGWRAIETAKKLVIAAKTRKGNPAYVAA